MFPFVALCSASGASSFRARRRVSSSLARSRETAGSRRQACRFTCARVGACVSRVVKTRRVGPGVYKARCTRNGISLRYVASIAFRKWSAWFPLIFDIDTLSSRRRFSSLRSGSFFLPASRPRRVCTLLLDETSIAIN